MIKRIWFLMVCLGLFLILTGCGSAQVENPTLPPTAAALPTKTPDWFDMNLTDVQTGETFTMNDYAGKVVLLETMAMWCPNCLVQSNEVRKLHELLGNPDDLISVSLDVDVNEDSASLKEYASKYGFDWHYAVAPLEVARALGNLYTAQYLNPPLAPMLVIDRDGNVHHLEYGLKKAEALQKFVQPFLDK